jgi:polyhydroxybutyrate depolymerase
VTTTTDASPPIGTSGCGTSGVATGLVARTTTVQAASRHYRVFVPDTYDANQPTRLVFVFHGLGGDGWVIRSYFGFEAEAAGGALFVYPDGLAVDGGTAWAPSDLAFFDVMLAELSQAYCIDTTRVFAAGHSYGAYMTNLVGCERGDRVRAIAPVSGGIVPGACKGPVAAWIAHGNADTTVSESEGIAARDHWRALAGCAATASATEPSPCVAYDGCGEHPVTWCSFAGGHYPLPDFTKQAIWDFFASR